MVWYILKMEHCHTSLKDLTGLEKTVNYLYAYSCDSGHLILI